MPSCLDDNVVLNSEVYHILCSGHLSTQDNAQPEEIQATKTGGSLWISCGFLSVWVVANSKITFSDRAKDLQDHAEILSKYK